MTAATPTDIASAALRLESVREALAEARGTDPGPLKATRIPGGASREAWLIEAGDGRRYVLRRDPPGSATAISREAEFALVGAALESGVPVPRPLHLEPEGGRFGSAGFVMEFVEGESVARRLLRKPDYASARERLPDQIAVAAARIHAIDAARLHGLLAGPGADPAEAAVASLEVELDRIGDALPAVELGLRWLRLNRPPPVPATLVHGDFRLGNFLCDRDGLRAVLDWELAHLGDPAEDLGWLCVRSWRFGADARRVAGLGDLDPFLAAYAAAGGEPPDPSRVRYWEVFGNAKWAVICAQQAHRHRSGETRSHELASLGRRICEPEWDLLALLEEVG